jgi:hypothetical protein
MAQQSPAPVERDVKGRFLAGRPRGTSRLELEPEVTQRILNAIRDGAYDWVAAESAGIGVSTFFHWIQRGAEDETAGRSSPYRNFRNAVRRVQAEARGETEVKVREKDPLAWLMKGPGRDRPGEPGWTDRPAQQEMPHLTIIVTNSWKV